MDTVGVLSHLSCQFVLLQAMELLMEQQVGDTPGRASDLARARDAVGVSMQQCVGRGSFPDVSATMDEFQALASLKTDPRMPQVLERWRSREAALATMTRHAIHEPLELIATWPEIIGAAREVRQVPAVKSIFSPLNAE